MAGRDGALVAGRDGAVGADPVGCDGASQTTAGALESELVFGGDAAFCRAAGGGGGGLEARRWGWLGWAAVCRAGAREADGDDVRVVRRPVAAEASAASPPEREDVAARVRRGAGCAFARFRAGVFAEAGAGVAVPAVRLLVEGSGAVPNSPIDGTPSEPPTASVCDRPMRLNAAAQPPTASVVAAPAPKSCVRALRTTRRWRRSARTRTFSDSHAGGSWYSGSESAIARGSDSHFSNAASSADRTGAGVTPREPGRPGRRDGVTDGASEVAGSGEGTARGFGGAAEGRGATPTSASFTGAGLGATPGDSGSSSSRSTRRTMRRGGQTPVRRDSSSSSLMFTIDRPVELPAAQP